MDTTEIRRLAARRERLRREAITVSECLRELAAEALREGVRPGMVAKLTGYSPAQVRIIARADGIAPGRPGRAGKSV